MVIVRATPGGGHHRRDALEHQNAVLTSRQLLVPIHLQPAGPLMPQAGARVWRQMRWAIWVGEDERWSPRCMHEFASSRPISPIGRSHKASGTSAPANGGPTVTARSWLAALKA